ncbi:MAG: hypothetical protein HOP08_01500 [Cyclobacteriaceae bacterium]|nr:hypothetical protein [Cyclobacteriaceae bacterium]
MKEPTFRGAMKHFLFIVLALVLSPFVGKAGDRYSKGADVSSVGSLQAPSEKVLHLTFISQSSSDSQKAKGDDAILICASDDLIQASVFGFHNRCQALNNAFDFDDRFRYSYTISFPPKQYSLLRILFRAIIAANAP